MTRQGIEITGNIHSCAEGKASKSSIILSKYCEQIYIPITTDKNAIHRHGESIIYHFHPIQAPKELNEERTSQLNPVDFLNKLCNTLFRYNGNFSLLQGLLLGVWSLENLIDFL